MFLFDHFRLSLSEVENSFKLTLLLGYLFVLFFFFLQGGEGVEITFSYVGVWKTACLFVSMLMAFLLNMSQDT